MRFYTQLVILLNKVSRFVLVKILKAKTNTIEDIEITCTFRKTRHTKDPYNIIGRE